MSESALLIAPPRSYRLTAYIRAAGALGVRPMVASIGSHPLVPSGVAGIQVDLSSGVDPFDELVFAASQANVRGVISTDDATVDLACRVAAELGLVHNVPQSVRVSRRKDLSRNVLEEAGCPCPAYRLVAADKPLEPQIAHLSYPCVVKPLAMSGSRGVIRCDSATAIESVVRRVLAISKQCDDVEAREQVIIENFLPGHEVALEGMLHAGSLYVLAIFDKPDPLDGPYFEETYYITPSRMSVGLQTVVEHRVAEAVAAYGLTEGPVHAELRVHEGDATVIEVAARTIGGDCARLLDWHLGQALEERVLEHALGGKPRPVPRAENSAGVLMLPIAVSGTLRRVEGVIEATRVPGIVDVVIAVREGYELTALPEGSSYLGFVFAQAGNAEAVEAALRTAYARLNVVTAPSWEILPGTTS